MTLPKAPTSAQYRPGELAPITGVYRVIHLSGHRPPHQAVVIRGEQLPPCRTCGGDVVFEVDQATSHVTHQWDFAGPGALTVQRERASVTELRRFRRYEFDLPLSIAAGVGNGLRKLEGRANNLSEGGVNATVDAAFRCDREADFQITLKLPDREEELVLQAELRHLQARRYGFQFVRLNPRDRQRLRRMLGRLQ